MTNELITINNVRGFIDENGVAQLNLDDIARGLGFTQTAKSGNESIRWERVTKYLELFGIPTGGDGVPEFIPENIFYRLSMKANNKTATDFQEKVANEILPSIRKHGVYMTADAIEKTLMSPQYIAEMAKQLASESNNPILLALRDQVIAMETKIEQISSNIIFQKYEPPKPKLISLEVRYFCALGLDRWTRKFYEAIMDYTGIFIPKSTGLPKDVKVYEYIFNHVPMKYIEEFVLGVEKGIIVLSKEGHWVNLEGYENEIEWNKILESFGKSCAYCGKSDDMLIAEHIEPQSQIGMYEPARCNLISNVVPSCNSCNLSKYTLPMEKWYRFQKFFSEDRFQKIQEHIKKYSL
jgi:prophage antirepressor-like protein